MVKEELTLDFWRPYTDNDLGSDLAKLCYPWRNAGKEAELVSMTVDKNRIISRYRLPERLGRSEATVSYLVGGNGKIDLELEFLPSSDTLPLMPRFGVTLTLQGEYERVRWFGRGPHASYEDRKSGAFVGLYKGSVWEQYFPYDRPQENGNKTDVRWMTVYSRNGGLKATGDPVISTSVYMFPNDDLAEPGPGKHQRHLSDVRKKDMVTWNIDLKQMGVGGDNSWGAIPHQQYLIPAGRMTFRFSLEPSRSR